MAMIKTAFLLAKSYGTQRKIQALHRDPSGNQALVWSQQSSERTDTVTSHVQIMISKILNPKKPNNQEDLQMPILRRFKSYGQIPVYSDWQIYKTLSMI